MVLSTSVDIELESEVRHQVFSVQPKHQVNLRGKGKCQYGRCEGSRRTAISAFFQDPGAR